MIERRSFIAGALSVALLPSVVVSQEKPEFATIDDVRAAPPDRIVIDDPWQIVDGRWVLQP